MTTPPFAWSDLLAFATNNQLFVIGILLSVGNVLERILRLRWGGRYCDRCGIELKGP